MRQSFSFLAVIKISDRYIGKQVLMGTLYAVIVLGLVLIMGNLFRQIQPLLVDQKAPLELVFRFVLSVVPVSLMYTLPWGFLSAVLLVFGRMSSHQEITSFRVAGVSLIRLSAPVFVIGAVLSLVSLWLNIKVIPHAKASSKQLLYDQATRDPDSLLKPGVVQGNFTGERSDVQKILIEGKRGPWVTGFHFYQLSDSSKAERTYVYASSAALSVDEANSQLRVKLEDAYFETHKENGEVEMVFAKEAEPLLIDLKSPKTTNKKVGSMTNEEILEELNHNKQLAKAQRSKLHAAITERYSFSMACFAFVFIAVPLGLGARRRDTSRGLIISLIIGTSYFLLSMLAEQLKSTGSVTLMLWAPNVMCVLLGIILFRKARYN
jgi:lipopolysaccharide export system permease protein